MIELCKQQLEQEKEILEEAKLAQETEQENLEALIGAKEQQINAFETDINNKEAAIKQYEEEISYKMLSEEEETEKGMFFKFNVSVILRADQSTQIETLSKGVSNFIYTPNEARAFLDLEAKEGGDRLLGNGASIPVEYTGAQYINMEGKEEKLYQWIQKTIKETLEKALQKA